MRVMESRIKKLKCLIKTSVTNRSTGCITSPARARARAGDAIRIIHIPDPSAAVGKGSG